MSSEISYMPSEIGWLCCRIGEVNQDTSSRTLFHSGFIPLAIFRDRLTALLYAYSLSTPEKREFRHFKLFIEDGSDGFEKPPSRGAHQITMSPEERAYIERLESKVCDIDLHYEGVDDEQRESSRTELVWVFPLEVINPPKDTISPFVKLTCTIWIFRDLSCNAKIVINKCEGCGERQTESSSNIPSKHSRVVCESELEYFPFGVPFHFKSKLAERLSTSLAKCYPSVSRIEQIPIDLGQNVARFLPFELVLKFLMPDKPRTKDTELEMKQHITFSLPKRIATSLKWTKSRNWAEYDFQYAVPAYDDFWEVKAKQMGLKYAINEIPENANWSSLGIVVNDDSEISAVRKAISFLRNRIPAKYLSQGSKCVVQFLMIPKENRPRYTDDILHATVSLKLEFYTVNGLNHCVWYLFNARQPYDTSGPECSDFLLNSTFVYLKESGANSESDTGDFVVNDYASFLVTAYDRIMGVNRDSNQEEVIISSTAPPLSTAELSRQLPTLYPQKVEFLLNMIRMDVSTGTLRQLWTKIASLFQISNFSFINHQDQTTPVNAPTDLVVLTDYIRRDSTRYFVPDANFFFSGYLKCIRNSALSTAYRNNSGCLETLKSFSVNVTVISIDRYSDLPRGDVRQVSKYRLKMSTDSMCEIFCLHGGAGLMPTDPICCKYMRESTGSYFSCQHANLLVLFDSLASLRHRPVQVECWDRGQGKNYPLLRNPFGFVAKRCEFYDVVFYHEFHREDRFDYGHYDNDEAEYIDPRDDWEYDGD